MLRSAVLLLFTAAAVAPAWAQQPQKMYKCVDSKGKVYYTQLPPPECVGRASQEMSKSGTVVIKRNEAPPTAEQRAKMEADKEAERKRKIEEEQRKKDEQRQTAALLNTYTNEKDIEEARTWALKENAAAIAETEKRIQAALKRQQELSAQKGKAPVKKLEEDLQSVEVEIKNQQDALEARRKKESTINAKYDDDKRRFVELTRKQAPAKK
jgi:Domain of unknown function (DUF4124)